MTHCSQVSGKAIAWNRTRWLRARWPSDGNSRGDCSVLIFLDLSSAFPATDCSILIKRITMCTRHGHSSESQGESIMTTNGKWSIVVRVGLEIISVVGYSQFSSIYTGTFKVMLLLWNLACRCQGSLPHVGVLIIQDSKTGALLSILWEQLLF